MLNGMLWIVRSGAQWRELPAAYGLWQSVYARFSKWRDDGTGKVVQAAEQIAVYILQPFDRSHLDTVYIATLKQGARLFKAASVNFACLIGVHSHTIIPVP